MLMLPTVNMIVAGLLLAMSTIAVYAQNLDLQPSRGDLGWKSYIDPQNGTGVDFPTKLFPVDAGQTERGTGRIFESADGRARLSVYALGNDENDTPARYLQKFLKVDPSTVDYRRVTTRFFAISGIRDGEVYYSRCNFHRQMHCIYISYPAEQMRAWDGIVTRVSLTLRRSRGSN
jgi:hypothetical protein